MITARKVPALLILAAGVFVAATPAGAQAPPDAANRVDEVFGRFDSVTTPGCAVGVARNGLTRLTRAYGMADLEWNVPNTPRTIFEAGSVSKQFTATAILLLALEGKLSLDDDVRTYVPEVPDYGTPVTLRHMITHTSGLRDWGSVAGISGWGRSDRTHTHAHVLDIVSRQSALNFQPGHEYSYSNTGFNLFAVIVERVSGMPFAEFSRERIFEPLGMDHTRWRDDYRRIVPGRGSAYQAGPEGTFRIDRPTEDVHGNGGLLTTVGDLLTWNEALTHSTLAPGWRDLMEDQGHLNDGRAISYAAGLFVDTFAGVPSVSHTGATSGYRAYLARFPQQALSVAVLCNVGSANPGGLGGQVARIYLGDAATDTEPPEGMDVPADRLAALAGLYAHEGTGVAQSFAASDGALRMGARRLVALSPTRFAAGAQTLTFEPTPGGRPTLRVTTGGYLDAVYSPVEPADPAPEDLAEYAGTYHSDDAETTLLVSVEDGALVARRRPDRAFAMVPVYPDAFNVGGLGFVRFHRDAGGDVVELGVNQARVYDMRFQRENR
ncbi:MAG TPA: serine hydrolase domain-containing protein [Longimicrobiales bacterium]|jgi:CubicO group peptidase (beta-lactamase class C family)